MPMRFMPGSGGQAFAPSQRLNETEQNHACDHDHTEMIGTEQQVRRWRLTRIVAGMGQRDGRKQKCAARAESVDEKTGCRFGVIVHTVRCCFTSSSLSSGMVPCATMLPRSMM